MNKFPRLLIKIFGLHLSLGCAVTSKEGAVNRFPAAKERHLVPEVNSSGAIEAEGEPKKDECLEATSKISEDDNRYVYSEWAHLIVAGGFLRIVKNDSISGYGTWFCKGEVPTVKHSNGMIDFSKTECFAIGMKFDPLSTDVKFKSCNLFQRLRNHGVNTSLSKLKLLTSSYPLKDSISSLTLAQLCRGVDLAFRECTYGVAR